MKISAHEKTVFVYDGGAQLVAEYTAWTAPDPALSAQVSYLTQDHLGSTRIITNNLGQVIKRSDYMAYGDEVITANRSSANGYEQPSETRKGYTGYERDIESGLDFAQARYYNPQHGRFTSIDPLTASANVKDPQTFNRYTYALNSPYKFTDPLGLISQSTVACGRACGNDDGGSGGGYLSEYENNGITIQVGYRQTPQESSVAMSGKPAVGNKKGDNKKSDVKILRVNLQDPNNLMDKNNLAAMQSELSAIFATIDVEVVFTTDKADYTLTIQQDRSGVSASETAVGSTPVNLETKKVADFGFVFVNQAEEAMNNTPGGKAEAAQDSKALGKTLGRAGSHEIGHYLLQQIDHSAVGVMSKSFKGEDWFTRRTRLKWNFDKSQKETIRLRLPDRKQTN